MRFKEENSPCRPTTVGPPHVAAPGAEAPSSSGSSRSRAGSCWRSRCRDALPDLVATAFTVDHQRATGASTVEVDGTIANTAPPPVPPGAVAAIYASRSNVIGQGSLLLGIVNDHRRPRSPGRRSRSRPAVTLPAVAARRDDQLEHAALARRPDIDPQNVVAEQNEAEQPGHRPGDRRRRSSRSRRNSASNLSAPRSTSPPASATWGRRSPSPPRSRITARAPPRRPAPRSS